MLLVCADAIWLNVRNQAADSPELIVGIDQGALSVGGQRLYPIVDGPRLPPPQPIREIELNSAGTGWLWAGKPLQEIAPILRREPPYEGPIGEPIKYATVALGEERSFGRALQAMKLLLRQGVCDAAIIDRDPAEVGGEEYHMFPVLRLESFADSGDKRSQCQSKI